jgi:glutathione S-transferase
MILYATPISSYSAKVAIALRWKGLAVDRRLPPGGSYRSPEYRAIVPTAQVPALLDGDFLLTESDAIIEYLEEIAPQPSLLPGPPRQRATARMLSRFHDFQLEPAIRALFPLVGTDGEAVEAARAVIAQRLAVLERLLPPGDYFGGPDFSLADCAFPASLHCLAGLAPGFGWRLDLPARLNAVLRVPAVAAVMADYAVAFDGWLATKRR